MDFILDKINSFIENARTLDLSGTKLDLLDSIQAKIDADLETGVEPIVGEYVDDLRGWKPEYNYVDKYYENEKKSGNNPVDLFDLRPEQSLQEIGSTWDRNERPETIDRPETNIAESPIETIAIDNLRERISNVE